jgi:glutaredoxin
MSIINKIEIYTSKTCPYCKQVKDELDKNNIEFKEKYIDECREEWIDVNSLTGIPTVPTIHFKNNYYVPSRDFRNPEHLVNILSNFKKSKFSIEKQAFEKLKTLNHNINIAFSRTDQLLRQIENKLNIKENEHKSTD